ncbi:hypothetical protein [Thiocapsa roseopersicina]|uniref:Uncharacterized protein n=1 Tax=Thiocapsa roseopersicina TaxID=1058 RepID=A0A1H2X4P4_THIRO|nr:hypothetical protein [Thiocapsa roseopersicina]SDW87758.1 hypothetical protein SAMN05421783_11012 [Thiocapsa roseopersicina]
MSTRFASAADYATIAKVWAAYPGAVEIIEIDDGWIVFATEADFKARQRQHCRRAPSAGNSPPPGGIARTNPSRNARIPASPINRTNAMKPETPTDPVAAMVQAMFNGGCTEEQMRAAKDAARSAQFAHLSDAELEALIGNDYPWYKRLSTPEIEAMIDAMEADADVDADTILALFANNTDLTDDDVEMIRSDFGG